MGFTLHLNIHVENVHFHLSAEQSRAAMETVGAAGAALAAPLEPEVVKEAVNQPADWSEDLPAPPAVGMELERHLERVARLTAEQHDEDDANEDARDVATVDADGNVQFPPAKRRRRTKSEMEAARAQEEAERVARAERDARMVAQAEAMAAAAETPAHVPVPVPAPAEVQRINPLAPEFANLRAGLRDTKLFECEEDAWTFVVDSLSEERRRRVEGLYHLTVDEVQTLIARLHQLRARLGE